MIATTKSHQQTLTEKYRRVRNQTLYICEPLKPEDTVVQPITDVSPPKWHMGHTTWFFETFLLKEFSEAYKVFHPRYPYLFNSYYEGAGERVQRSYRGNMTRPSVDEIKAYRQYVDEHMQDFLQNNELTERALYILQIGLQHEQQHQELLIYDIKYILGHNPLFPVYRERVSQNGLSEAPEAKYIEIPDGMYNIGYEGHEFHFDNEEGRHRVFLEPFSVLNRLVTNAEYLEFIEAGGYEDYRWWFQEAFHWVNTNQISHPLYWFKIEGAWHQFTLHGLQKVNMNEPVTHVSFYEADAFAKWKGKRLLTEFEWEIACNTLSPQIPESANFVESENRHPAIASRANHQFYGDVWEWTNSSYLPYPYYKAEESTLGEYNGKFMINQMVLRGGSCATPVDHIRPTYRNFFHPHLQWLFSGIRLAESIR